MFTNIRNIEPTAFFCTVGGMMPSSAVILNNFENDCKGYVNCILLGYFPKLPRARNGLISFN